MQLKKETIKIGQFEFTVHKDNLKRKIQCSIHPNKTYFFFKNLNERRIYSHPDLELSGWK